MFFLRKRLTKFTPIFELCVELCNEKHRSVKTLKPNDSWITLIISSKAVQQGNRGSWPSRECSLTRTNHLNIAANRVHPPMATAFPNMDVPHATHKTQRIHHHLSGARHHKLPPEVLWLFFDGSEPVKSNPLQNLWGSDLFQHVPQMRWSDWDPGSLGIISLSYSLSHSWTVFYASSPAIAVAGGIMSSGHPSACLSYSYEHNGFGTTETLQIWPKHSVELKDELIRFWWSDVKVQSHCDKCLDTT